MRHSNHEAQLTHYIQRSQFNNAVHALHLMMQQRVKLQNVSLFPSVLQSLKLCKKHHFHILELIDFMKFNSIELDSNTFAEILGICVAKNDEHSAKQIALLWMDTMPTFPILELIHCLSAQNTVLKPPFKYHKLGKQERIWQSIIDELTSLTPEVPSFSVTSTPSIPSEIQSISTPISTPKSTPNLTSISPTDFITDQISQIQMNLTAKHHGLAVKHLHELHSFITNNPMDIPSDESVQLLHRQNEKLSTLIGSKNHKMNKKNGSDSWTQWLLREELMSTDSATMESNDVLRKLYDLGFKVHTPSALNALFNDIQKAPSLSDTSEFTPEFTPDFARYQISDHIHEVERRLPQILHFVAHNVWNGTISRDTIHSVSWINNLIHLILETSVQTNTASISRKMVDRLFQFMRSNYGDEHSRNLLFHHQLFNQLKVRIISEHQRLKQVKRLQNQRDRDSAPKYGAGYGTMRKLLQILNGFDAKDMVKMKKHIEIRQDILPLIQNNCAIESFYVKSKYVPSMVRSRDLSSAIIEAAFRFEHHELGHLLYYLFYHKTPSIIDSDAMTDFGIFGPETRGNVTDDNHEKTLYGERQHSFQPPMVPLQIEWMDLRKIYSTLLGLSTKATNHLQDIDVLHLLHYAPLPVQDVKYLHHDAGFTEMDTMRLNRGRQQRVLQVLAGLCARTGSFEDVRRVIHYFEHDSVLTNNMRSFGAFYFNETLLHRFTVEFS